MQGRTVAPLDTTSSPGEVRAACRSGAHTSTTAGLAPKYAQANLVVVPKDVAFDFMVFCHRNPKPCPLLDVTEPGNPVPALAAPDADLRTDLPYYRVFRHGELVDEPTDITAYWDDSMAAFLIGCSFTFEQALLEAGVPVRHLEAGTVVPMYQSTIPCTPAGPFHGDMIVSMRMIPHDKVVRAVQVTSRYPGVHGAPVHIGDPAEIGIDDLDQPLWSDPPVAQPGDVPVFWACGVTPQAVAMRAKPELMITHRPGCMFITDIPVSSISVL